jgi:hypothetical protein
MVEVLPPELHRPPSLHSLKLPTYFLKLPLQLLKVPLQLPKVLPQLLKLPPQLLKLKQRKSQAKGTSRMRGLDGIRSGTNPFVADWREYGAVCGIWLRSVA